MEQETNNLSLSPMEDAMVDPHHGPRQSLELETEDSSPSDSRGVSRRRRQATSPAYAQGRYMGLATLAVVLSLTCPGTYLYEDRHPTGAHHSNNPSHQFQWKILIQTVFLYVSTLILFQLLHGSDPGRLKDLGDLVEDVEQETLLLAASPVEHDSTASDHSNSNSGNRTTTMNHRRSLSRDDTLGREELPPQHDSPTHGRETTKEDTCDTNTTASAIKSSTPTTLFHGTRRRYCPTCRLSPPLRSHHCKQCNCCIATFDHHCDFVGTCIGERNHARFWWFLLCQALAFSFLCHLVGSSRWGITTLLFPATVAESDSVWMVLRVVAAKCYLYPLRWAAWIMVFIHTFMALSNSTTFELSKGSRHLEYLQGTKLSDLPFGQVRTPMHDYLYLSLLFI